MTLNVFWRKTFKKEKKTAPPKYSASAGEAFHLYITTALHWFFALRIGEHKPFIPSKCLPGDHIENLAIVKVKLTIPSM